jgi:hypothetical protein
LGEQLCQSSWRGRRRRVFEGCSERASCPAANCRRSTGSPPPCRARSQQVSIFQTEQSKSHYNMCHRPKQRHIYFTPCCPTLPLPSTPTPHRTRTHAHSLEEAGWAVVVEAASASSSTSAAAISLEPSWPNMLQDTGRIADGDEGEDQRSQARSKENNPCSGKSSLKISK